MWRTQSINKGNKGGDVQEKKDKLNISRMKLVNSAVESIHSYPDKPTRIRSLHVVINYSGCPIL